MLEAAQLAQLAVGRSTLTLLGWYAHATETEHFWFRRVMAGENTGTSTTTPSTSHAPARLAVVRQPWQAEIRYAERLPEHGDSAKVLLGRVSKVIIGG